MSKFFDETMQSLLQAVEISKGNISVVEVEGMPAKTYRALEKMPAKADKKCSQHKLRAFHNFF